MPCAAVAKSPVLDSAADPRPRVDLAADADASSTNVKPNVLIAEASSFPVIPATTRASALALVKNTLVDPSVILSVLMSD